MTIKKNIIITISLKLLILLLLFLLLLFFLPTMMDYGKRILYGVKKGVYLEGVSLERLHRHEVEEVLLILSKGRSTFPENATLQKETGEIIKEKKGRILALEETLDLIFLAEANTEVKPVFHVLPPYITTQLLESLTDILSSFTTGVGGGNGRVQNIILSTKALNNTLLLPGEVLSFNETVGPPTAERGYQLAPIIMGGEVVPGYGGGICQTATTLYNAALKAGLEILERHAHSIPIDYVPPGMDATIAYESLDLKFRNNRLTPIIIKGWAAYQVSFSIMGLKEE